MNLFFWKKNNTIDVFASSLANEMFSTVQPMTANDYFTKLIKNKKIKKERKEKQQMDYQLEYTVKQINQFKTINSLGVYGKARLHLKFSERLKELGYDEVTTKKINDMLLVRTP